MAGIQSAPIKQLYKHFLSTINLAEQETRTTGTRISTSNLKLRGRNFEIVKRRTLSPTAELTVDDYRGVCQRAKYDINKVVKICEIRGSSWLRSVGLNRDGGHYRLIRWGEVDLRDGAPAPVLGLLGEEPKRRRQRRKK